MAGRGKRVSDEEILQRFVDGDDPVYSASQIADGLEIGTAATDRRLREFQEQGWVDSKKIGPSRAWWITDDGRNHLAGELDVSGSEERDV